MMDEKYVFINVMHSYTSFKSLSFSWRVLKKCALSLNKCTYITFNFLYAHLCSYGGGNGVCHISINCIQIQIQNQQKFPLQESNLKWGGGGRGSLSSLMRIFPQNLIEEKFWRLLDVWIVISVIYFLWFYFLHYLKLKLFKGAIGVWSSAL
jgi:hypothetical protein